MNTPAYIIVHHTGGTDADPLADTAHHTFEMVNEWHRKMWNFKSSLGFYIGYHYFIDNKGKVTQGRADSDEGAHCIGKNKNSIGVCLAGNFDAKLPTSAQVKALKELLLTLSKRHNISAAKIVPHRTFANKSCYGRNLSDTWAASLVELSECKIENFTTVQLIDELKRRIASGKL